MNRGDKWSRTENEIVVDAYIRLLEAEKSGHPLVKAEVRREGSGLQASFELPIRPRGCCAREAPRFAPLDRM